MIRLRTGFTMSTHWHSALPPYDIDPRSQPFYPSDRSSLSSSQTGDPLAVVIPPSPSPSSTSSLCTQHRYALRGTKGNVRPCLSLLLTSRSPKPEFLPLFVGKDIISGVVELDISKPETIREVRITVCLFSFTSMWESSNSLEAQGRVYPPYPRIEHLSRYVTDPGKTIGETLWGIFLSIQIRFPRRCYYLRVQLGHDIPCSAEVS